MEILNQLQFLCKEFNLQFIPGIYQYIELSSREFVIMHFLSGCPLYEKFGNQDLKNKLINLEKFIQTDFFQESCNRKLYGSVFYLETIEQNHKIISLIEDDLIKNEVLKLFNKLKGRFGPFGLACVTQEIISKKENNHILLHEFIHMLLRSNNIKPRTWFWEDGLVVYMEYFA